MKVDVSCDIPLFKSSAIAMASGGQFAAAALNPKIRLIRPRSMHGKYENNYRNAFAPPYENTLHFVYALLSALM